MQSVEERFLLRTSNAWDGHYARVMLLVLPINKTFPWILNRAERKYPNIFGKCTQTEFLLPLKRKPEDTDLFFLRRVEMMVFLSSNQMETI